MVRSCRAVAVVVAIGVAGAAGCGAAAGPTGDDITFDACAALALTTDAGMTAAQGAGLEAAIALWNDRASTRLTRASGPAASDAPTLPIHFQTAAGNFHGLYDAPSGQVFINNDLDGEALAVTIAHEVGHAFGLVHIPGSQRASVMNPNNLVVEPNAEDVDTLAMRWGVCLASADP